MASQQRSTASLTPTHEPCSFASQTTSASSPAASPASLILQATDDLAAGRTRAELHAAADAYGLVSQQLRDRADLLT